MALRTILIHGTIVVYSVSHDSQDSGKFTVLVHGVPVLPVVFARHFTIGQVTLGTRTTPERQIQFHERGAL
eukprot:253203-Rhodomonas_salina.1